MWNILLWCLIAYFESSSFVSIFYQSFKNSFLNFNLFIISIYFSLWIRPPPLPSLSLSLNTYVLVCPTVSNLLHFTNDLLWVKVRLTNMQINRPGGNMPSKSKHSCLKLIDLYKVYTEKISRYTKTMGNLSNLSERKHEVQKRKS
jgi:hypothetical protein